MVSTITLAGPKLHAISMASTKSGGPQTTASILQSEVLETHPVRPNLLARAMIQGQKSEAFTSPRIKIFRAESIMIELQSGCIHIDCVSIALKYATAYFNAHLIRKMCGVATNRLLMVLVFLPLRLASHQSRRLPL